MKEQLTIFLELVKIRITFAVMVTTFLGYILASRSVSIDIIAPLLGTFLLACGSAVFNHVQERESDKLMARTRNRPLPSGKISLSSALIIGFFLALTGSIVLYLISGIIPLALGLLALLWYNGIYTPLKKKHPMAIIPGSLIGAIPPAIGWVAGGGDLLDHQILMISFFFFVWQVPHFWLLMLYFDEEYRKAGFPTLRKIFSKEQIRRITFMWMLGVSVLSIGLPLFGILDFSFFYFFLVCGACWLSWRAYRFLIQTEDEFNVLSAFRGINMFALLVVLLISLETLMI